MGSPTVMTRGALDCDCDEEICLLSCHVINNQNNNVDNKYLFCFYSQRQQTNYYEIVYQNEFLFQKVFFFFKHQIPQNAQYVWFLFARQIFPRYADWIGSRIVSLLFLRLFIGGNMKDSFCTYLIYIILLKAVGILCKDVM